VKKILITGASGFLGRYLLWNAPDSYRILAQFFQHPLSSVASNIRTIRLDLKQKDWSAFINFKPDIIIHTAAIATLDICQQNQQQAREVNVDATKRLVDLAAKNAARFIFTSTDIVFDGEKGDYSEGDIPNPINYYGETKVAAENHILENLPISVILRTSIFHGLARGGRKSFTELMLENLRKSKKVSTFVDEIRNPLPVSTLAKVIWELAESEYAGILHVGGEEPLSRYEMAVQLCEEFNLPKKYIIPVRARELNISTPRPQNCSLNISFAKTLLRTELPTFRQGLVSAFN
jgi:dTDP-4-dehydrorhamnose reductase